MSPATAMTGSEDATVPAETAAAALEGKPPENAPNGAIANKAATSASCGRFLTSRSRRDARL